MLDDERAREFAGVWVQAWNAHDLDRIMTHYEDDVVLVSPVAARILDDPCGTVSGKAALRSYFQRGLDVYPNLKFELLDVMWDSTASFCITSTRGDREPASTWNSARPAKSPGSSPTTTGERATS